MKIQCKVCLESPIVDIPNICKATDGEDIHCPECDKWLATAQIDRFRQHWGTEDDTYLTEDGKLIQDYPIKIVSI